MRAPFHRGSIALAALLLLLTPVTRRAAYALDRPPEPLPSAPTALTTATTAPQASPGWLVPTLHGAGFLSAMYLCSVAIWPQSFDVTDSGDNWARFRRGFSTAPEWRRGAGPFEWDGDPWSLNVIGHGLFGSEFYLRYRQYRQPPWVAALLALAWSVTWEYLVENWHKQPSGIDLVWTPVAGSLLGEGRYQLYRQVRALRRSAGRHLLLYLIDPFGQLERDLLRLPE
ncbi:MAG: DUF3943 domain-containing protein [Proteobacteria bacterium]|nr:DUF3943 domain-containing protein [Pseudomonadota bacterium]